MSVAHIWYYDTQQVVGMRVFLHSTHQERVYTTSWLKAQFSGLHLILWHIASCGYESIFCTQHIRGELLQNHDWRHMSVALILTLWHTTSCGYESIFAHNTTVVTNVLFDVQYRVGEETASLTSALFSLNPVRTTCRLVKRNIWSFIEPIREGVRENSLMYLERV